jgi:MHS family proline/betaine transporter-like MFS transporter
MIGNGFEWYDFALYGQMAFIIGHLFFPSENEVAQQLAAFAAFAVAFVFRPLGAILFGWIGDKFGRKKALVIAILMMALPTGAIGLLPTYETIGVFAPILLVLIRILQGLSLGGEFGGAITYVVEHSDGKKRGVLGSTTIVSLIIGFLFGSFVVLMVKHSMSAEAFESWGWRVPFLLGVLIGAVGFYIRHHCAESPVYETAKTEGTLSAKPVRDTIIKHWRPMLRAFGAYTAVTMPFYLIAIFFISYSKTYLKLEATDALLINAIAMFCMLFGTLFGAILSDAHGRRCVMLLALLAMALCAIPVMLGMNEGSFNNALMLQALLGFVVGIYIGPIPALLVEIFPTSVRYTGMSLAFNLATVVFGGSTPYFCIQLLEYFQTSLAIAVYMIFCCMIAGLALWKYKDRWQEHVT